ncbi:MAG: cation transporter [Lautropia sp.]
MGAHCCHGHHGDSHRLGHGHSHGHDRDAVAAAAAPGSAYRRILWTALAINGAMFAVEVGAGISAGSMALLADSLDFAGDAANYAISLWVLGMTLAARARASVVKALSMAGFGAWVLGSTAWRVVAGTVPDAMTMGIVGVLALAANLLVAALLYAFRNGDSNMRGVWLCTRNDAIGNLAVLLAALGVFGSGTRWPDLLVAAIMGGLALSSAIQVLRQARGELATA